MSTSQNSSEVTYKHHTSHESWLNTLISEGPRLDETGAKAALLAVDISGADERQATQLRNLLKATTGRTDQICHIASTRYAVLLAPVDDLASVARNAQNLQDKARSHQIPISVGFASRRSQESLLDTWARAEGELDRLHFRTRADRDDVTDIVCE